MQRFSFSRNALLVAVLVIAAAAYVQSFSHQLVLDDHDMIERVVASVHSPWDAWNIGNAFQQYYRPLFLTSLWIDNTLFGDAWWGFHAMNLALHLAAIWCAFLFAERLFGNARYAAAAAGLFAMAPVHTENVSWISGRTDLLCAIFIFLALIAFYDLLFRRVQRGAWLAPLFFFLALLCKETAAVVPAICLVMIWMRSAFGAAPAPEKIIAQQDKSAKRPQKKSDATAEFNASRSYGIGVFLTVAGLVVFMLLRSAVSGPPVVENVFPTFQLRLLNATRGFAMYVWHALVGGGYEYIISGWRVTNARYNLFLPEGAAVWTAIAATIFLFAVALLAAIRAKRGVVVLGLCGFAFFIAPALGFVPILSIFSVRFLYIPSFFLALAVVDGARALLEKKSSPVFGTIAASLVVAIVLWCGVETFMQDANWTDDVTLMQSLKKIDRDINESPVYQFCMGNGYRYRADYFNAATSFRRAIERYPEYSDAYVNLGGCYLVLGQTHPEYYTNAIETYGYALRVFPRSGKFHNLLGDALLRHGEQDKARQTYYEGWMMEHTAEARQRLQMLNVPIE